MNLRALEAEDGSSEVFGWETKAFTREHEVVLAEYLLLFITLLCAALVLQFFVGKIWKMHTLTESGSVVLLGMLLGGIIRLGGGDTSSDDHGESLLGFNSTIFFIGFLPPIIFNSGYQINRRLFFKNMGGILALAVVGTAIGTAIFGAAIWGLGQAGLCYEMSAIETVTFGSLISATDPVSTLAVFSELKVHPTLFYLVFGESVLNDAVAITLFKTTSKYIGDEITHYHGLVAFADFVITCVGSTVIGYFMGLIFAWIFKVIDFSQHRLLLVTLFVAMVYIPFLLSETLQLSGILTILFSAVSARRYISHNIPPPAQRASAFVFELIAYLSETGVFLYLGIDVFSKNVTRGYHMSLVLWSVFLCLIIRAIVVYPLLALVNKYRAKIAIAKGNTDANLIPKATIHMVWFSGLRGAVAYASANIFPDVTHNKSEVVATTTAVILYTIFIHGGLTVKALDVLGIETGVDDQAVVSSLPKVTTSAAVNWEHKYIYPLVIRGYNDPEFDDPYKPKSDVLDTNLGNTQHITQTELAQQERRRQAEQARVMELRNLELDSTIHETMGEFGYNKLAGLGPEVISIPRSYSSAVNVLKRLKVGTDGKVSSLVPKDDPDDKI